MKFPKDIPKDKAIKILNRFGFEIVREGNHIAMIRDNPDGSRTPLTMPNHKRIKGQKKCQARNLYAFSEVDTEPPKIMSLLHFKSKF